MPYGPIMDLSWTKEKAEKEPMSRLYNSNSHMTSPTAFNSAQTSYTSPKIEERGESGNNQDFWAEVGYECSEHAIVWHIYNVESTKLDTASMDSLNRGIDVLLVFTGLFSAVLTTFIIQSYQQMLPGPSDETNALLTQLIVVVRSSINDSNAPVVVPPIPGQGFVPSDSNIHWVNGLWFAALACSLSAALVSMLAKQWIQPMPNTSGSPRHRARERQRQHIRMRQWKVSTVISILPLLVHIALLLFFAGIIVLLWSGEAAITAATFAIVACAYLFYFGSMWVSLVYPDCPYQHPISEHLRHWISKKIQSRSLSEVEYSSEEQLRYIRRSMIQPTVDPDHFIDACSFVWLLEQSSNEDIIAATLQAIGGLSYDFTAFHVLRNAGAVSLVLKHFIKCFYRDHGSYDIQWHVSDAQKAEKYCRAWVRLTHGTSIPWPRTLQAPLEALREYPDPHVSAIASCTVALNSLDSRTAQLALMRQLEAVTSGKSQLSDFTESWLLDTILECSLSWELQAAVVSDIAKRSVPVLLQLLQIRKNRAATGTNHIHVTITLILSILIQGKAADNSMIWDAERRGQTFRLSMVQVLTSVIQYPILYGVDDDLLVFVITEFSQLVAPFFSRVNFSPALKQAAQQGLSNLYLQGRLTHRLLSNHVLAEVLQILHPPNYITQEQCPRFTQILLKTLAASTDLNVQIGCIRLLEDILKGCDISVINVFTAEHGFATLLRLANIGLEDSRRLQTECIRTLCIFINSMSTCHLTQQKLFPPPFPFPCIPEIDEIFSSDFFTILQLTIRSRQWWLAEVADIWLPSLLQLYRIKPQEPIWRQVETTFRKFADTHIGEDGSRYMLAHLDEMSQLQTASSDTSSNKI